MRAVILAASIGVVAGGCGGSSSVGTGGGDGGGDGGASVTCTLTLTGAVSATSGCTAAAAYDVSKGVTAFAFSGTPGSAPYTSFAFGSTLGLGGLVAKTYDASNVTNAATALVGSQAQAWTQFFHDPSNADEGTFSLSITSEGVTISNSSGTAWTGPHGSLDATLGASNATGATGAVTAHATF